jgi:NADH dehydrogenase FAD-containing subunit
MSMANISALLLQASTFDVAAQAFSGCMAATVRMGMTTKMQPDVFEAGFAKSCKTQEAAFRAEAIKVAMQQGRTEAQAIAEVDGNIANGRRSFLQDQASYIATGKVPR